MISIFSRIFPGILLRENQNFLDPEWFIYNDPNELAERMKILVGSMAAGNNSPVIKNDLTMINDEFLKIGAIDQTTHEKFYKKYLK